jgi:P4 family phage/plasmid primase-like protien
MEKPTEREFRRATKELAEKAGLKQPEEIFRPQGQVKFYIAEQPIYYDKNCLWWMWNHQEYKWELADEVDILNRIESITGEDIITPKKRTLILNSLKQECRKTKPKDIKPTWIQFKGKIFDIKNGKEFDATPDFLITNPIPWELGNTDETPVIDKLLEQWLIDDKTQDKTFVATGKEIIAYSCCSEQFLQSIIALTGAGSNGKGTYLKLISNFLGKENVCSSDLKVLATRNFETSALYKKLLCQMGEVDIYDLKNTNLLKKLTGEDLIRYEFKGKTPFSEYSPTTCIIATNSLPITPDKSIGFYRRWLILDFPHQFKVSKDILRQIPDQEYNNLGRVIVNILKGLYKKNEFTNSGTFEDRERRYEERSNPVQKFIEEHCDDEPGEKIKLQNFSRELNGYLKKKHLRPMSVRQVGSILREEGYEVGARKFRENGSETSAKVILNLKFITTKTTEEKNGEL